MSSVHNGAFLHLQNSDISVVSGIFSLHRKKLKLPEVLLHRKALNLLACYNGKDEYHLQNTQRNVQLCEPETYIISLY